MNSLDNLRNIGKTSVRILRERKLASGHPFLINSRTLPEKQSYLEFPDRRIKIVTVAPGGKSFNEVRILSESEANEVRLKYKLI